MEEDTLSSKTISTTTSEGLPPIEPVDPVTMGLPGLDETTSSMMTHESFKKLGNFIESTLRTKGRSERSARARNAKWYARKRGSIEYEMVYYDVVFFRDQGKCGICGKDVDFETGTLDHVIPASKHGSHTYDNIQLAHRACNREKGNSHEPGVRIR